MSADSGSRQIFTGTQIGTGLQETGERCGAGWPSLNFVRTSLQGVHARLQAGTGDTKWKYEVQIACHQAEENLDTSDT
jgi:hypothetical protein